jgi:hypothetical protein
MMIVLCKTGWCFRYEFRCFLFLSLSRARSSWVKKNRQRWCVASLMKCFINNMFTHLFSFGCLFFKQYANERMFIYECKVFFLSISANNHEHQLRIVTNCTHTHTSICTYRIHLASTNKFIEQQRTITNEL